MPIPKAFLNFEEVSTLSQSNRRLAQISQIDDLVELHSYVRVLHIIIAHLCTSF